MATIHEVLVRDHDRNILGPLTRWDGCSIRLRFNNVGSGSLTVHPDEGLLSALRAGDTAPGGIVLVRDDGITRTVLMSGNVVNESETEDGFTFEIEDDTASIISNTEVLPVPSEYGPTFSAAYDVRTGVASTIIYQYVNVNAGPGARSDRVTPGLALAADPGVGDVITGRGALGPLDELLRELALAGGGFRFFCQQFLGTTSIVFSIGQPTDRQQQVIFSRERGTLGRFEKKTEGGGPNYVFAGPRDGLGANRSIYEQGDSAAIAKYGRRETFVDVGTAASPSEVYQRIAEVLAGSSEQTTLTVEPSEYVPWVYGRDYQLGDIVGTEFGPAIVREVTLTITPEGGLVAVPVIGTVGSSADDVESRQYAAVERRLSNIERQFDLPDRSVIRAMLAEVLEPPIGKIEWLAGSTVPVGYLAANGQSVLRSAYPLLFAEIGTVWGSVDGTHFNVPNLQGRLPIGANGSTFLLGATGGAATAAISDHQHAGGTLAYAHTHTSQAHTHATSQPHTHPGSHSHTAGTLAIAHTHTSQAHTHPGSHSHDRGTLAVSHDHQTNIDHDHPSELSGKETSYGTDAFGRTAGATTGNGHQHNVDLSALGTTNKTSSTPNNISWSGVTGNDSNAPAASYSGSPSGVSSPTPSGSTDPDSSAPSATYTGSPDGATYTGSPSGVTGGTWSGVTGLAGAAGSISVLNPYAVLNPCIYAGE